MRNTTYVRPPRTPEQGHHLSEDLADDAILWLQQHKAFMPDKPFFMYWASGAIHGPHHIMKQWADKYKGKFDDGWDNYRERVFKRAKEKGWIPQNAQLTARPASLASWESIPEDEKPFQRRLMEVAAGYAEHVDHQVGRLMDELDRLGYTDNTIVMYIWGDNGSSAEGQHGTISELLAQNGIPTTTKMHIAAMNALGGLDVLGSPKADNQYHAGWAWAGSTPYKGTKLLASHFGGTRNPIAIRWPAKIKADTAPRSQFLHVNDVVPTLYDIVGITPPRVVNGISQDPFDGVSFKSTLNDVSAKEVKHTQYFEIMGSRAIYSDGWMACAFGPREPWTPGTPAGFHEWTPGKDKWELYNLKEDWSEANDLAEKMPEKLAELKDLFLIECTKNKGMPIGGGLWVPLFHPELRIQPPYHEWSFSGNVVRMPEFCAPALGNKPNAVTIDATIPANGNGVLYALGGFAGGLSCYMKDGLLCYEYNLFEIMRTQIKTREKLRPCTGKIEIETRYVVPKPGGPLKIVMKLDGKELETSTTVNGKEVKEMAKVGQIEVAPGMVPISAPLLFTANDCLDIGTDLGSPVSVDYFDNAPFKFNGKIEQVQVKYVK